MNNVVTATVEKVKSLPVLGKVGIMGGALAGINMGKGFADIDIKLLGIGGHRNWFSHSAATSALLYGATRWYSI